MIREFTSADAEQVVALWRPCGLIRPWNDPHRDIERKMAVQPGLFFVGEDAEAVVAAVMSGYDGRRGSVNYPAVSPARRHEGLGAQLLAHAEDAPPALGCPKTNLQVRADNAEVAGFYQRQGYERFEVIDAGKRFSA